MKKLFVILVLFIFIPLVADATSGTCSSHGGVNCSAGADWDGSVICNDNWRYSTESYSSMSMCRSNYPICYYTWPDQASFDLFVPLYRQEVEELTQILNDCLTSAQQIKDDCLNSCTQSSITFRHNLERAGASGAILENAVSSNLKSCNSGCSNDTSYCHWSDYYVSVYQTCIDNAKVISHNCPANSSYNDLFGLCQCNSGYTQYNGQCLLGNDACKSQFGDGSSGDGKICYCTIGYSWNSTRTKCITSTVQSSSSSSLSGTVIKKLIKVGKYPGIYLLTDDGQKRLFSNRAVFSNWYGDDFSGLETITQAEFDNIPYGKNITIKSGGYFKFDVSDNVYLVQEGTTVCRTNTHTGTPYIIQSSFMGDYQGYGNCQ